MGSNPWPAAAAGWCFICGVTSPALLLALVTSPAGSPLVVGIKTEAIVVMTSVGLDSVIEATVVGEGGLEPPRPCGHWHLKPARLPIPPLARSDQ